MRQPPARAGWIALLVGVALAVVAVVVANRRDPPSPVAPADPGGGASMPATSLSSSSSPVAGKSEPRAAAAAEDDAGIVGVARTAKGVPLAGFTVLLMNCRKQESPRGRIDPWAGKTQEGEVKRVVVRDDGAFAFASITPGDYRVQLRDDHTVQGEVLQLARGESRNIELVVDGVVATLRFARGGQPVTQLSIEADGPAAPNGVGVDADGVARCIMQPGICQLRALQTWLSHQPLLERTIAVAPGATAVAFEFEIGGADVDVDVHDAHGNPHPVFQVTFDADGDTDPILRQALGKDGHASLTLVPPGRWRVTVRAADLEVLPAQLLEVPEPRTRQRLEFVGERATTVRLVLRGPGGAAVAADPATMPPLVVGDRVVPCVQLQPGKGRDQPPRYGYEGVRAGRATLALQDRSLGDAIAFACFDPVPAVALDVALGTDLEIALDVAPRAFVDLRGCERSGREDITARIQVFAGARRVQARPEDKAWRWSACLPPGVYRVVVDRSGQRTEHELRVERADVLLRLRPQP